MLYYQPEICCTLLSRHPAKPYFKGFIYQVSSSSEDNKEMSSGVAVDELEKNEPSEETEEKDKVVEETEDVDKQETGNEKQPSEVEKEELHPEAVQQEQVNEGNALGFVISGDILSYNGNDYKIKSVDGGDRSGSRSSNVAVDIGFGDRVYWGLTNGYGQLVYVLSENIILQNDNNEPVNSDGRYYDDEANVPGTEHKDLDQGHIIADSLGGVANAYNITPQESTLNRHGDQAYMEKGIRDASGCTNFIASITYANTSTQIPSSYKYMYTLMGNEIVDEFPNVNPDDY